MNICLYPGSFDPVTKGHVDIIERAGNIFDKVIVGVLKNFDKKSCFSIEKRVGYIRKSTNHIPNIEVHAFEGLTADFAQKINAKFMVRGLRTMADFEYEFRVASVNNYLAPGIESVFLMTNQKYAHISSSIVRQIGVLKGDISGLVPAEILDELKTDLILLDG
ncbi:pantetheine-phosphate adenylyltransferase [Clostridia bacterium OttesenSCG-928-F22]|nr:pantetheine-phosphate adenylyltransferase [Clostridia bacterium OttesenSCG-928-F22]